MRIAFAGTPEFAAYALKALMEAGHQMVFVLTQPDRPAGRGLKLLASPVKQIAEDHHIAVYQPHSLQSDEIVNMIKAAKIDCLVVAAYGLLIPSSILEIPQYGCLNIHASLLPRWRGAAPIQRAILHGDEKTGVCIMQMEKGLDTGPVLQREELFISSADTASTLHDKLKETGASLITHIMTRLEMGEEIKPMRQPDQGVTYAEKLKKKEEAIIDWRKSAMDIDRQVRAFNPFPVAQTFWKEHAIRIWNGYKDRKNNVSGASPGTVIEVNKASLIVACGEGLYHITELQKAGGKRLNVSSFLTGNKINIGDLFSSSPYSS